MSDTSDLQSVLTTKKEELLRLQQRRQEREARRRNRPNSPSKVVDVNALLSQISTQTTVTTSSVQYDSIKLFSESAESAQGGQVNSAASSGRVAELTAEIERLSEELKGARKEMQGMMETIGYEKGCQTDFVDEPKPVDAEAEEAKPEEEAPVEQEMREEEKEPEPPKELTPAEVKQITSSYEFQSFVDQSAKKVERVLAMKYDPLVDYSGGDAEEHSDLAQGEAVGLRCTFFDERRTTNRAVTSMEWSPKFPELLAVSYNANVDNPHDADGLVLVWNSHVPTRPEYEFQCQPNILVGGTYSGQVVLWDQRVAKKTPVQRSSLSTVGHTHPVYSLGIVGSQNAHNLITSATDGSLCSWNLDMINEANDTLELLAAPARPAAVTSMSFPTGDVNNFIVGSEEGNVYQASRHGAKAGIGQVFEGHTGPITGVDFHKAKGSTEFSHLFISSSTDWTVKLWSYRQKEAIASFENSGDYIYDAAWSPKHPALFASVDGLGQMDFWNINLDSEVPQVSVSVQEGRSALNRVKWANDGRSIAVGDADGYVHVYDVNDRLSQPRSDEISRLRATLDDMQTLQAERKEAERANAERGAPARV